MFVELGWSCDFCKKSGLIFSKAGILYCRYCNRSYGEVWEEKLKVKQNEQERTEGIIKN